MGLAPTQLTRPPMPETKPPTQGTPIPLVCPHCSAPYDGYHCEYCGTSFIYVQYEDEVTSVAIDPHEVSGYASLRYDGRVSHDKKKSGFSCLADSLIKFGRFLGIDL